MDAMLMVRAPIEQPVLHLAAKKPWAMTPFI
jgi:hypothetical protein